MIPGVPKLIFGLPPINKGSFKISGVHQSCLASTGQQLEAIALLRKRQRSQDQPQRFAHHLQQAADGSGRSRPAQS